MTQDDHSITPNNTLMNRFNVWFKDSLKLCPILTFITRISKILMERFNVCSLSCHYSLTYTHINHMVKVFYEWIYYVF